MSDKYDLTYMFISGDGDRLTMEEFNKMMEVAENSPIMSYEEFKEEVDEWLERRKR